MQVAFKKYSACAWAVTGIYTFLFFWLFASTFSLMVTRWNGDDFNYCYLVPPLIVYLIWELRDKIAETPIASSWLGLVPFCLGLALFWLGELGGEFFTLYVAAWLVLVGIVWSQFGTSLVRLLWFPLLMIPAMFPLPRFITNNLSLKLKLVSSEMGVKLMHLVGMSAYREGNVIDLGFTSLQVVDACSGLRYLFPIILLGFLLGYFYRLNLWRWIVLVASTIPLIVFINGVRIAVTGYLYPYFGAKVAEGFFHDFAGWFTFMVALGLLLPEIRLLKMIPLGKAAPPERTSQKQGVAQGSQASTKMVFAVTVLLLGATLAASAGIDFREKIPASKPLAEFPARVAGWQGRPEMLEKIYLDELDLSDYVMLNYRNEAGRLVNFYVAYYASQRKGASIHSPASCLPGGGWKFLASGTSEIHGAGLPEGFHVQRTLMAKGGQKQMVYYWFLMRGRVLTNIYQIKLATFWDALTKQRTDGALVRLVTPLYPGESAKDADARLVGMTRNLMPVLSEFIPGKVIKATE